MNPIAFLMAIVFIGFLWPIFKGIADDCFYGQSSGPLGTVVDRVFGIFFMVLFLALSMALLWVGTQPKEFFQ